MSCEHCPCPWGNCALRRHHDGPCDATAPRVKFSTPSGGVYPYEVHYNTGDSRAGFTNFADAVAFYRAKRPYSTIVGKDFDGESDGLTDEEREEVQSA